MGSIKTKIEKLLYIFSRYKNQVMHPIGKIKSPLDRLFEKENGGGAKG